MPKSQIREGEGKVAYWLIEVGAKDQMLCSGWNLWERNVVEASKRNVGDRVGQLGDITGEASSKRD